MTNNFLLEVLDNIIDSKKLFIFCNVKKNMILYFLKVERKFINNNNIRGALQK